VVLKGHVRVAWEGDILEAEEAEFDLANMQGWLKNGKVFMGKSHLYFQSDTIRKYGASSYRFKNARITGCDGDKPAWSFNAEEGDINIDGRTKLWHSTFKALDTPIAYSPFLSLPGGAKRQSGLLIPDISHSTQRGYVVNQPYYWAIDDEHDMTFYENTMTRRGLMQGLEYRHSEDPRSKGDWRVDFLRDRKVAISSAEEEDFQRADGLLRPNKNRWWVRSKYNGYVLDPNWNVKVDLDAVSDQNYLREFGGGASGYEASRRSFLKEFGRDIDVADSLTRNSVAYLSRSWDRVGVTAKVGWTQNLSYANNNSPSSKNPTVQTLPEVNFFAFKDNLPGTPLDVELASRYSYFWREYGTRGARMDLRPNVSLPLTAGPLTLIPTAGLRTTSYTVPQYTNESSLTTTNKTPTRTFPELGFSAFTEFHRVFGLGSPLDATEMNVGKSEWFGMRHSVMPRLELAYQPVPQSQDRLPTFDAVDRLVRRNLVTYSVTNVFDRKRSSVVAAPNGNATIPVTSTDYLDFLRVRLEQSFDRDEASRTNSLSTYTRRPYSDLMLETSVKPEKYLTLTSKSFYSPYRKRFTEHENSVTVTKEKVGEFRFSYDYLYPIDEFKRQRTQNVQVLGVGVDAQLTEKIKLTTDYRMDIAGRSDLEKTAGLTWTDQCYNVQLLYSRKPSDQSVELRFNLLDFGKQ
jgi:LPS-assembly protein